MTTRWRRALTGLGVFWVVLAWSGLLLASPAAAAVSGKFSIEPYGFGSGGRPYFSPVLSPGEVARDKVVVANRSDAPMTLDLRASQALTTGSGGFALQPGSTPRRGLAAWIHLPYSKVTIPPLESDVIAFTYDPPAGIAPGNYDGGIVAEEASRTVTDAGSMRVQSRLAVATAIYGRVVAPPGPGLALLLVGLDTAVPWGLAGVAVLILVALAGFVSRRRRRRRTPRAGGPDERTPRGGAAGHRRRSPRYRRPVHRPVVVPAPILALALVAGLLGAVGGLGASIVTGAVPSSAATPTFTVTCAGVPFVGTLTLSGSEVTGTLSPTDATAGTAVSLSDLVLQSDLERKFAVLGGGAPLTVDLTMAAAVSGGTPTASTLIFSTTVTDPATAATIPETGLPITATGTAAPSSFTASSGSLSVDAKASAAASSPSTTLSMVVNGNELGPYDCTNVAVAIAATTPVFTVTCAGVPIVGTLTLSGSEVTAELSPSTITKGTAVSLTGLSLETNLEKKFADLLTPPGPLSVDLTMGAALTGATPAASGLTFSATVTVPPTTTIPKTGLPITAAGTAAPSSFTATSATGAFTVRTEASVAATSPTTTLSMVANGQSLGPYHCTSPSSLVTVPPLTLSPTKLASGRVTTPYPATTLAASGGTGATILSVGDLPPGLSVDASTGVISGTPTKAGTFEVTVSAEDGLGTVDTVTYALTVQPGNLTLSCTKPVVTSGSAIGSCQPTVLTPVTLDGATQTAHGSVPTIYVRTARRYATSGWTLTAAVTVTTAAVNTNTSCATAADFCNSSVGPRGATGLRGQIPAKDLQIMGLTCTPATASTGAPTVGSAEPLTKAVTLCTASPGTSGGIFDVGGSSAAPASFQLTVPPYVYAGTYYATVVYTAVSIR